MSKFSNFLGIDVSKDYFDAVVVLNCEKTNTIHSQFTNDSAGLKELVSWLKKNRATIENTLVCIEHTGMYGKTIIQFLLSKNFNICVEMSSRIIKNSGIQRGKNDKIDAERIAFYAMKNQDELQLYKAPRQIVDSIRKLISLREHLIATKAMLIRNSNELKNFEPSLSKLHQKYSKATVKGIETDLNNIEKKLDELIQSDEKLANLFEKATSVTGVGKVTALFLICFTNEFTMYSNPRQLACYCGVVPFEYTSGKSVRAKPRVHYMANKKLKKQLHMCALSSIRADGELKEYYNRKVADGKNKMLVINNVRNKIIHRICACIRDDKQYEKRNVA
jgi:transposase